MTDTNPCDRCRPSTQRSYHSTYYGHDIEFAVDWPLQVRHYHSGAWSSDTLEGVQRIIFKNR